MEKKYSLTFPQQNIWLVNSLYNNSKVNLITGIININKGFDVDYCKEAINNIIKNNDAMRINIVLDDKIPYQVVEKYQYEDIDIVDMQNCSKNDINKYINEYKKQDIDILSKKLFEFKILKYEDNKGAVLLKMHHIISDAWSYSKIIEQFVKYYTSLENNEAIGNLDVPGYIEFVNTTLEYKNSEKYKKDEEFWNEYLSEFEDKVTLKDRIKNIKNTSSRYNVKLKKEINYKILEYCKENRISPYVMFLAALSVYLYRIKDKNDFVIGTPSLNRANFKEKQMLGMFVSTLPLRVKIQENEKFLDVAHDIARNTMSIFRHQKYPYINTLKNIRSKNNNNNNLYGIILSYQNARVEFEDKEKYDTKWYENDFQHEDLQIHILDMDSTGVLEINYDYLNELFDKIEIEYLHTRIMAIIENAILDKDIDVENIEIMSKEEKYKILYEFNDTKTDYPKDKSVIELFEEQVEKTPDNIALVFEDKKITYKELNERANQLANKLNAYLYKNKKVKSNNIGVMFSKKMETIEIILAVLKNGLTFVPIDINLPEERIKNIIKLADIKFCFCDFDDMCETITSLYYIDNIISNESKELTYDRKINEDLYIIFTSGSTGIPKGVRIKNNNIVNLMYSQKNLGLNFMDKKVLQFATMSFDVSYQEIFSTICFGGTLVLLDEFIKKDSIKLTNYIDKYNIDILFIPPAYLRLVCEVNSNVLILKNNLTDIIVAGEQLIITKGIYELIKKSKIKLHNHYGPAETHVVSTIVLNSKNIDKFDMVPIGKPINNTQILILDKKERLLPINIAGEIAIIGESVGNGYISNNDITKKVFKKSKIFKGNIMYKTGDFGCFNKNGFILFFGRLDFQVKVNGYRVEIEGVEKAISTLPYICNVIIKVQKNIDNKNSLIAILELTDNVAVEKIKSDLSKILPKYMIPNIFYRIDKMPLSNNGKISRKDIKLEELENIVENNKEENIESLKKNEQNTKVIKCVEKALNININSNINLFDYGMDSLQAIKLQTELMKDEINLSVQDIYDNPTLYQLIEFVRSGKKEKDTPKIMEKTVNEVKIKNKEINNVLLTGVTGYLGIYVLKSLMESNEKIKVTCLTRKYNNTNSSVERVRENIRYYFGESYVKKYMSRIDVFESDISCEQFALDNNTYNALRMKTDVVINCAAIVSHYGNRDDVIKSNLNSISNIIEFVKGTDIIFNHISTIGISGNGLVKNSDCIKNTFTEDDLYIGQEYKNNIYVLTKALGENNIYNNMDKISANVIRVGNLTNSEKDYKFQRNYTKNAFQTKIGELFKLGYIPKEILNNEYDITPVDICADNIVKIALSGKYNGVYHVFNNKNIKIKDIIKIMYKVNGIKVEIINLQDFKEKLFKNNVNESLTLFQDVLIKDSNCIKVTNDITLERGYGNFNTISEEYYYNMFKQLWRNANEK